MRLDWARSTEQTNKQTKQQQQQQNFCSLNKFLSYSIAFHLK